MKKTYSDRQKGFTLIEILVALAVIGILSTLSLVILVNTIRNSNKANITNEAKENLALISEYFDRDVRTAESASITAFGERMTLQYNNGKPDVVWLCKSAVGQNNGHITRKVGSGAELPITNRDPFEGVNVYTCRFSAQTSSSFTGPTIVTFEVGLKEGVGISSGPQELKVDVYQKMTAFVRSF